MDNALFHGDLVDTMRMIYTPSDFAKHALLHIQEIGTLQAQRTHISKRERLNSYLFFTVHSGSGTLFYDGVSYALHAGDCVYIDCKRSYYHQTSEDLWKLSWIHFNGPTADNIYQKYAERGGQPVFTPKDLAPYLCICEQLYHTASGTSYVRDMEINQDLAALLTLLLKDSWNPDSGRLDTKRGNLADLKNYLDDHYTEKIPLDSLAERFYINKFYLTRIFKEQFGTSINNYLLQLRITHAKRELRFTDKSIEEIGRECGIGELYYFSRVFKNIEGVNPSEFRKAWKS